MKRWLLASIAALLGLSGAAHGRTIVFEFRGIVNGVSGGLAGQFATGQQMTGFFEFDSETEDLFSSSEVGLYEGTVLFGNVNVDSDDLDPDYSAAISGGQILVFDDTSVSGDDWDIYAVQVQEGEISGQTVNGWELIGFEINLYDLDALAFASDELPLVPPNLEDFAGYPFSSLRLIFGRDDTSRAPQVTVFAWPEQAGAVFAVVDEPGTRGTTQVSGIGVFNTECQPPVGSPPGDLGDYPPIELTGSLHGCWYTYVSSSKFNRSGTYQEKGTEIFVGCLNGTCGTFETTYTFTAKYVDDTFAEEIHGRCHHPIVGGTGGFAGAKGVINFKDDVVNLKFDYKGHISLE